MLDSGQAILCLRSCLPIGNDQRATLGPDSSCVVSAGSDWGRRLVPRGTGHSGGSRIGAVRCIELLSCNFATAIMLPHLEVFC